MSTSSNTRPDPALVRISATELLASFRDNPPHAGNTLLSDGEMEGQMRGLPDICFQLAHTRAETAEIGACAAVGYIGQGLAIQGRYLMRIYRKTEKGWSPHTYILTVEAPPKNKVKQPQGRKGTVKTAADTTRPPTYTWSVYAPPKSTGEVRRKALRRQVRHH